MSNMPLARTMRLARSLRLFVLRSTMEEILDMGVSEVSTSN